MEDEWETCDAETSMDNPVEPQKAPPKRSALRLVSIKLGAAVQAGLQSTVSSWLSGLILTETSIAATSVAASAAMGTAAATETALRISLKSTMNSDARKALESMLKDFLAKSQGSPLEELARMSCREQIGVVGVSANLVPAVTMLALQQCLISYRDMTGKCGSYEAACEERRSAVLSTAGGLGGNVAGAALGSLLLPGVGAIYGSVLGGILGSNVTVLCTKTPACEPWNPDRRLDTRVVDEEWVEILDSSPSSVFRSFELVSSSEVVCLEEDEIELTLDSVEKM